MKSSIIFYFNLTYSILIIFLIWSCKDDFDSKDGTNFDREALLENLGSNIIIPAYENYQEGIAALRQRSIEFTQAPNSQTLQTLREQFSVCYLLWQKCSFYEFGPAVEVSLKASTNSFPTDKQKIEANMASGLYDLNAPANTNAIGFPAIDYLIYGINKSDNQIIIEFVDEPSKRTYLNELVLQMETRIENVVDQWSPNGTNYIESFIVQSGTGANSSLSLLLNAYSRHLEISTKNKKIGTPLGILSGNVAVPASVEGFYSHISVPYMSGNTEAMKLLFLGDSNGKSGLGFDDWLDALDARIDDRLLSEVVLEQFDLSLTNISEINDPFSQTLVENPTTATVAYDDLQQLSDLLKTNVFLVLEIPLTD